MQTDDGKLGKILKYLPVNVCEAINTLVSGEGKVLRRK